MPFLPSDWQAQVALVAARGARRSHLNGHSVTARDADFLTFDGAELGVVDGDTVAFALPWLSALYRGLFLETANALGLGSFRTAEDRRSAINLNVQGRGQRYEWHVDSNPLTGLLFATTLRVSDGGTLVFRPDPRAACEIEEFELTIQPEAGALFLYDARHAAHCVLPVTSHRERISIPMNYYVADQPTQRPADLDNYLYRSQ